MSNQERLQKFVEEKKKHLRNAIVYKNQMIEYQKKGDTKNAEKSKAKLEEELSKAKRYQKLISQRNAILLNSEKASRDPEFRAQWLKSIEAAVSKSRARHEINNDSDSQSDEAELEELSNNDECPINTPSVSSLPNSHGLTSTKGKLWLKKLWSAISCSGGGSKKSKKYKKYNKKTRQAKKYKKTKKQKNKVSKKETRSKKY
jgi:hypothetical protein